MQDDNENDNIIWIIDAVEELIKQEMREGQRQKLFVILIPNRSAETFQIF